MSKEEVANNYTSMLYFPLTLSILSPYYQLSFIFGNPVFYTPLIPILNLLGISLKFYVGMISSKRSFTILQ